MDNPRANRQDPSWKLKISGMCKRFLKRECSCKLIFSTSWSLKPKRISNRFILPLRTIKHKFTFFNFNFQQYYFPVIHVNATMDHNLFLWVTLTLVMNQTKWFAATSRTVPHSIILHIKGWTAATHFTSIARESVVNTSQQSLLASSVG